jgi:polysaccharide biosynthesis/export protein
LAWAWRRQKARPRLVDATQVSIMNQPGLLSSVGKALKGLATVGFLSFALTGSNWGQTGAPSSQQQQTGPAPSTPVEKPASASPTNPNDETYIIGNSDLLEINVWKEPALTESVPVRSDGKISMPLIGDIIASGRTPRQLEEEITTKLRSYLTAPDVTVIVQQMNSQKFNILGRVSKPGSYSLSASTTVLDAIAEAGGFQDFAKQKRVYILRRAADGSEMRIPFNYKEVIRGTHPDQNIKLKPNDTIFVP